MFLASVTNTNFQFSSGLRMGQDCDGSELYHFTVQLSVLREIFIAPKLLSLKISIISIENCLKKIIKNLYKNFLSVTIWFYKSFPVGLIVEQ